jgi:hypothetical protein
VNLKEQNNLVKGGGTIDRKKELQVLPQTVPTLNRGARSRLDNGQYQLPIAILVLVLVLVWADADRTLISTTDIEPVECANNHCVKHDRICVSLTNTSDL